VQQAAKCDPEFGELASNPATFFQNVIKRLDYDSRPVLAPPEQPMINLSAIVEAKQVLHRAGTWLLNDFPYLECYICGLNHVAKTCPYKAQDDVPRHFCVKCLLPIWEIDGIGRVHHPTQLGNACTNVHRLSSRKLFLRARLQHRSIPQSVSAMVPRDFTAAWCWLFAGQVPGVLQLHLQMDKENFERTRCLKR
jgi:hypothetical protein